MKKLRLVAIALIAIGVTTILAADGPGLEESRSDVSHATRPNILFIMSDDHAAQAAGAYDSWLKDYVHTPALDRLAAEGMRFTNVCT